MGIDVKGRRRKWRSKRRWMDSVNVDLRENGLSREETQNRAAWRQLVRNIDPGDRPPPPIEFCLELPPNQDVQLIMWPYTMRHGRSVDCSLPDTVITYVSLQPRKLSGPTNGSVLNDGATQIIQTIRITSK